MTIVTDYEFAMDASATLKKTHVIYKVRSGFLLPAIRARIATLAESLSLMVTQVSLKDLPLKLLGNDLFGVTFALCDGRDSREGDILPCLRLIACEQQLNPCAIFINAESNMITQPSLSEAAAKCLVIEEKLVSESNLEGVCRFLVHWNRLDEFPVANRNAAIEFLRAQVKRKALPVGEVGKILDELVLSPTCFNQRRRRKKRGDLLNECLMNFLLEPKPTQMRKLLQLVDGMRTARLREGAEIVLDLYKSTQRVLEGSDRRYQHNQTGAVPPLRFVTWALRLIDFERTLLFSEFSVSFERLCREFMATDDDAWIERFERYAGALPAKDKDTEAGGLDRQRSLLFRAVCDVARRLETAPQNTGHVIGWLASLPLTQVEAIGYE